MTNLQTHNPGLDPPGMAVLAVPPPPLSPGLPISAAIALQQLGVCSRPFWASMSVGVS